MTEQERSLILPLRAKLSGRAESDIEAIVNHHTEIVHAGNNKGVDKESCRKLVQMQVRRVTCLLADPGNDEALLTGLGASEHSSALTKALSERIQGAVEQALTGLVPTVIQWIDRQPNIPHIKPQVTPRIKLRLNEKGQQVIRAALQELLERFDSMLAPSQITLQDALPKVASRLPEGVEVGLYTIGEGALITDLRSGGNRESDLENFFHRRMAQASIGNGPIYDAMQRVVLENKEVAPLPPRKLTPDAKALLEVIRSTLPRNGKQTGAWNPRHDRAD